MVIVVGLVGGGAVGGLYVGQVDWDAYFSDGSHHIGYKTNSLGQIYSVIHTDPAQDDEKNDGYYYAVTRYMIQNSQGCLVMNCDERIRVDVDENGVTFSHSYRKWNDKTKQDEPAIGLVTIPGAHLVDHNNNPYPFQMNLDFYVISETHTLEIQHKEDSYEKCVDSIYNAENFFNVASEMGFLYLAGGLEYWNDFDFWEENIAEYGAFYCGDHSKLFKWDWMIKKGYFRFTFYDVKGVQTTTFNPGYKAGVIEEKQGSRWVDVPVHYSTMRYQAFNMEDAYLILIDDGTFESRKIGDGYLFNEDKGIIYVPHAQYIETDEGNYYLLSESNKMDTLIMTDSKDELRALMKCGQRFIEDHEGRQLKFIADGEEADLEVDYNFHVIRNNNNNNNQNNNNQNNQNNNNNNNNNQNNNNQNNQNNFSDPNFDPSTFDWNATINEHLSMYYNDYTHFANWSGQSMNFYDKGESRVNTLCREVIGDNTPVIVIKFQRETDPGNCKLILRNINGLQYESMDRGYLFTYEGHTTYIPVATYVSEENYFILSEGYVLTYFMVGDSHEMCGHMSTNAVQFFDSVPGTMLEFISA